MQGLYCYEYDTLILIMSPPQAIISGAWTKDNILALGSADRSISLTNIRGRTIELTDVEFSPVSIQFAAQKADRETGDDLVKLDKLADSTLSLNLGGRAIMLYNLYGGEEAERPKLTFPKHYGKIVQYQWFSGVDRDNYMMVGFSEGQLEMVNAHTGETQWNWPHLFFEVRHICTSPQLNRAAVLGSELRKKSKKNKKSRKRNRKSKQKVDVLEIFEEARVAGETVWRHTPGKQIRFDHELAGHVTDIAWTSDGQFLTVAVNNGRVYTFVENNYVGDQPASAVVILWSPPSPPLSPPPPP